MQRPISISNNNILISLKVRDCECSVFIDITDLFAKSFNYVLFSDVEGSFCFCDKVHSKILVVFVGWQSVFDCLLLVEWVDESEGLWDFFDVDGEQFGGERVNVPGVVVADSQFEGTEEECNIVDSEDVLGPRESRDVMKAKSLIVL